MSIASSSSTLSPIERVLSQSLELADYRDVHLYAFTRRTVFPDGATWIDLPQPIAATSSLLKRVEYFRKLLTSGFVESKHALCPDIRQYAHRDEYEYDSDSDLDEAGFDDLEDDNDSESFDDFCSSTPSFSTAIDPRGKGRDDAIYISTPDIPVHQRIHFLPLRSENPSMRRQAQLTSARDGVERENPQYGMKALQDIAHEAILDSLTPENIVEEAFSRFFTRHDKLREHAISYLMQHYFDPRVEARLQEMIPKVVRGEFPHCAAVLGTVFGIRMALTQPEHPPPPAISPRVSWGGRTAWTGRSDGENAKGSEASWEM
ncbi:hypothetical protein C8Q73DRAFT_667467 [Cubamyces lactineus]|nr:hypothetical protein C8Q73DRAFT_667467 [Cubamyces lactineus]